MSKEDLVKAVQDYGCGMLKCLPLHLMTKEQIIKRLKDCNCPLLHKLITKQI